MEIITSKDNKHIKELVKLCASSKERKDKGLFVIEGARLCEEAANSGLLAEVLFTKTAFEKYSIISEEIISKAENAFEISENIASKIADTQGNQGVFGVCRIQKRDNEINEIKIGKKYLLLENIQDPSNLGAICRIVDALGLDGVITSGGCDIYNPKAQRAAMGSLFRVNIFEIDNAIEFINEMNKEGMLTIASTPRAGAEKVTDIDFSKGSVCVIGNEGNGVTPELMDVCKKIMTIPMSGKAESLNASTAAAIIAWEMVRG